MTVCVNLMTAAPGEVGFGCCACNYLPIDETADAVFDLRRCPLRVCFFRRSIFHRIVRLGYLSIPAGNERRLCMFCVQNFWSSTIRSSSDEQSITEMLVRMDRDDWFVSSFVRVLPFHFPRIVCGSSGNCRRVYDEVASIVAPRIVHIS